MDIKSFYKENKWSIWILAISLIVLAVLLYFILRKPSSSGPIQPKVSMAIDAPTEIASGSELVYKIDIKNQDNAGIKNAMIDLIYPTGFSFTDSVPKPTKLDGTEYAVPPLDPGQDATIMIKGNIQGNAGETKAISAIMHYSFSNLNSDFVTQAQAQTQIKTADVSVQFDGPTTVNSSEDLTYTLSYSNYTDQQINNFVLSLNLPKDFHITSADPKATTDSTWNIGALNPNQSGQIKLTGNFAGAHTGDQESFSASAQGAIGSNPSFTLSAGQLDVTISPQPLSADINLDSPTDNGAVPPGAQLQYTLVYKNNTSTAATGLQVQVTLTGQGSFDLNSIRAEGANVHDNIITWDGAQIPQLASLGPGESGQLAFSVNVNNPATRANNKNIVLLASSAITSNEHQQPFSGQNVSLKVETAANLGSSLTPFSGAEPPRVGASTTYQVNMALNNATNDINSGKLTLNLPSSSSFDQSSINPDEAKNVTYDKSTKQITWNVGTIAAHAGEFVPARKLQFNVTIVPGQTNRQAQMTLVNNIKFSGTDSFTGLDVNISADDITTQSDPAASGGIQ